MKKFFRSICAAVPLIANSVLLSAAEPTKVVHSQPSFGLASKQVELSVTEAGGHMAPVTFYRDTAHPIQPYHISPWQDEPAKEMPAPVLNTLRGDFFCMPFGGNAESVGGESHPPHGEIAGSKWKLESSGQEKGVSSLVLSIDTKVRKGKVTKRLMVVDGENAIYSDHWIEGFAGNVPLGHHATLRMPEKVGSVRIATSPIQIGSTYPGTFSDPSKREYQALLPGAVFQRLNKVPAIWKDAADRDLSYQPGPQGYADLIQLFNATPSANEVPRAWVAATFADEGFVWFALKDPTVLNSTVFWMENHGRHGHPWNGRNNCLGLEDVTAYFADGLAESMKAHQIGGTAVRTSLELKSDKPTSIRYIQGVAPISKSFDNVQKIEFEPGKITLVSESQQRVTVPVHHEFLSTGKL